jgi:hypothetical protein
MDRTFEIGDRVFSVNGGYGIVYLFLVDCLILNI